MRLVLFFHLLKTLEVKITLQLIEKNHKHRHKALQIQAIIKKNLYKEKCEQFWLMTYTDTE